MSKELTPLQKRFVAEFAKQGFVNASKALKAAGSDAEKSETLSSNAARMVANDKVRAAITELRAQADEADRMEAIAGLSERRKILSDIARTADRNPDKVSAIGALNHMDQIGGSSDTLTVVFDERAKDF